MTERFEMPMEIDLQAIDRLVDGELSAIEERTLLSALDARPEGWRRCALAFVEARAWTKELGTVHERPSIHNGTPMSFSLRNGLALDNTTPTDHDLSDRERSALGSRDQRDHWVPIFTVAASVALAFFLGTAAATYFGRNGAPVGKEIALPNDIGSRDEQRSNHLAANAPVGDLPTMTMTLVDQRSGVEREIEIPLVEAQQLNPRWFESRPSAIPDQDVEALRRSGYRVNQERLYVPVVLDDGRQAIVPLDQAVVQYDGMRF